MTDLTAIDILIAPDASALGHAAVQNDRLRAEYPVGFALDDSHQPHITLLQRYVRSADLDNAFSAVEGIIRSRDVSRLSFQAIAIRHMSVAAIPGVGIAAIVVAPSPEVLQLQDALIKVLKPFIASGGTADAFETSQQDADINADTIKYVERYVPDHSGSNYVAHLTVGLAPIGFLGQMEAAGIETFTFHPSAIAIFKLGNNGTARKKLKAWPEISQPG